MTNYSPWPGIGLAEVPVNWAQLTNSAALSAKSTAGVERRRSEGKDTSTFHGISRKSDELSKCRAPTRMKTSKKLGPEPGEFLQPESKTGKLRDVLAAGPMTRAELCKATGIAPRRISGYLKNDVRQGRIRKIVQEGCLQKFELA